MKLSFRDIEPFVKSPNKAARVILVYGPDTGLVRERSAIMGKTVVQDLNDPFNAVTLRADALADDPARLSDEANAISMMGGDRLIRVEDGADKLTVLLKSYLENPSENALVIVQAGGLGPRSSLRKLCESAKNAAAVPCYVEDERNVAGIIRDTVAKAGLRIDGDAVQNLARIIAGDRGRVRTELEKLITYKGDENSSISLKDVKNACGGTGEQGLDDLVYAVAGRKTDAALKAYSVLLQEGVVFVVVLRAMQNHFRKLYETKSHINDGLDIDSAMKKLSPPIFFKKAPLFKGQLNSWSLNSLHKVMGKLTELEAQCKQTGMPVDTLCSQAILAISKTRAG